MQKLDAITVNSPRECPLFPKRIRGTTKFNDVNMLRTLNAWIVAGFYENVELMRRLHAAEFSDFLQHNIIHAVLVLTENALCFYANLHGSKGLIVERLECFQHFSWYAANYRVGGNIMCNNGTGSNNNMIANSNTRQYGGIGTNPDIVADGDRLG